MLVTVKLYGNLKRHMPDKKEIAPVEMPPGTTIAALLARLGVPDGDVWMSALNDSVVPESTELHDGDVLEVFEPVGGGGRAKVKNQKEKGENRSRIPQDRDDEPMPLDTLPVTFEDVRAAAERLRGVATRTPVLTSRTFNAQTGREVFFKCENFQRAGAFKFRGAYNRLVQLSADEKRRGVVAFSSGNHAQGVALAARLLGIPAVLVMPNDAPAVKLAATRGYGAEVIVYDRQTGNREQIARQLSAERGLTVVPPFNDPYIIAGQGTAALELVQEVPDLDALVTPVGGGGLIGGCALAAKGIRPEMAVYGVEAEGADDARQSLREGRIVTILPPKTIADGIRTESVGPLTFAIMRELVDDIVLVSDAEILEAVRFALLRMKIVVEPTGAVPIAAVMRDRLPATARRVGIVVSGGNIDPGLLSTLFR